MRENLHEFAGRGKGSLYDDDQCRIIECAEGTVLAIIVTYGGVEFIHSHCRRAMIDPWGLYCGDPFLRASNAGLTRTWAEPMARGLFLFRPARLEIIKEQDWMTRSG